MKYKWHENCAVCCSFWNTNINIKRFASVNIWYAKSMNWGQEPHNNRPIFPFYLYKEFDMLKGYRHIYFYVFFLYSANKIYSNILIWESFVCAPVLNTSNTMILFTRTSYIPWSEKSSQHQLVKVMWLVICNISRMASLSIAAKVWHIYRWKVPGSRGSYLDVWLVWHVAGLGALGEAEMLMLG